MNENEQSDLTLSIARHLAAPRAIVWRCWTEGELLKQWYCPKPWQVTVADIDPRPGGRANVTMEGPAGERHENPGCYLEVTPLQGLVFTDAMTEGFVPKPNPFIVGFVEFSDHPEGGTKMVWGARHWTDEARQQHEKMGFHAGWNAAADQLDALAKTMMQK
jgi:uncharacterized protein YndB with AHSA1/START domain